MKKIKSYTSIWNVEKVIYAINDLQLPFPITFTQMTWFVVSILFVILFSNIPPLSFIEGVFLKYLGLPVVFTWFMSQKTFDGKKPYGFLKSILSYLIRSKLTYAYKPIKLKSQKLNESITIVRSELYEVSD
ncbi:conjugal transfer protein [Listeria monocytogenes]|nr:conjugal transfer protein [Listeria monocytogenes]EAE1795595.1 conjugal transfer protein [Listeria monocytogenes]EAH4336788.1 conjugal transfer protein [Listeria monocytogenes]ECH7051929.1 conjugal transfer protein [Listeria monocytogenes]EIZ6617271.1 conjugal transfer protein [Listeria monocytogenes]